MKIFNFINNVDQKCRLGSDENLHFFLKPETSLSKNCKTFFLPEFSADIRCSMGIAIRICKLGKYIKEKYAHNYYKEFGLCISMYAYDLLEDSINKRLPWDIAVSFDSSTVIGNLLPVKNNISILDVGYRLEINKMTQADTGVSQSFLSFDKAIEFASKYYTLKIGDFFIVEIFNCNKSIQIEDLVSGYISGEKKIEFKIK